MQCFMEYLLQNHGRSTYCCTVGTEEAETNVFVTLKCTQKPTFQKKEKCNGYKRCFNKFQ